MEPQVTKQTIQKARSNYRENGVECVFPHRYLVHSPSGEDYVVDTARDTCDCISTLPCSHMVAVELFRSARRRRVAV